LVSEAIDEGEEVNERKFENAEVVLEAGSPVEKAQIASGILQGVLAAKEVVTVVIGGNNDVGERNEKQ
jgi:hypothetical protein